MIVDDVREYGGIFTGNQKLISANVK